MWNDCVSVTPEGKIFGETLRNLRNSRVPRVTQDALAASADLATNHISDLERGLKVPTLTTILQLALALRVEPAALLADFTPAATRAALRRR
jgi:transcriptional regulator with XRE-family HTH domain